MTAENRRQRILELIQREGTVNTNDLCAAFHVSDMTIRRDLNALSNAGQIIRTHGGAVSANEEALLEPPYSKRLEERTKAKKAISNAACRLILPGQRIFLDSGTTTLTMARALKAGPENIFITNSSPVAMELALRQCKVIVIGGYLDRNSFASRGSLAEEQLARFRVDVAFLGCNAISPEGDVMVGNLMETGIKKEIMRISEKKYLLADAAKFSRLSLVSYAHIRDCDGIITDQELEPEVRARSVEQGGRFL